jgi:photoactive yellow protein
MENEERNGGDASPSQPVPTAGSSSVVYQADAMSPGELDALPYGMIQLDTHGVILRYSSAETRLSGLSADECIGRSFFTDVAPCTQVQEFFGRFVRGVQAQQLDAVFTFRFAFVPPKDVRIHMFFSKVTRSVWVKVVALASEHGEVA